MTIKQMAMLNVAKFVAGAVALGVANSLAINYFGIATVGIFWTVVFMIYAIKFVYDVELSKLEARNSLKKIKESGQ